MTIELLSAPLLKAGLGQFGFMGSRGVKCRIQGPGVECLGFGLKAQDLGS